MIEIPVLAADYQTVFAIALFAGVVTQWLKKYVALDIVVNLVTLALSFAASFVASLVVAGGWPSGEALFQAFMVGFFGASVAVLGFEVIKNIYDPLHQLLRSKM